jgi:hypothetical protein
MDRDKKAQRSQRPSPAKPIAGPLAAYLASRCQAAGIPPGDPQAQQEWLNSTRRLIGLLQRWLRDADSGGTLRYQPSYVLIDEPGLGRYRAVKFRVILDRRTILEIVPRTRNAPEGCFGCVDLVGDGGSRKVTAYRTAITARAGKPRGRIEETWTLRTDDGSFDKQLSRESFEEAFLLLQPVAAPAVSEPAAPAAEGQPEAAGADQPPIG